MKLNPCGTASEAATDADETLKACPGMGFVSRLATCSHTVWSCFLLATQSSLSPSNADHASFPGLYAYRHREWSSLVGRGTAEESTIAAYRQAPIQVAAPATSR
jgi:hypothetical protein